ncbi:glycohydrolase toxin TNT-related protein [Saccharomonospora xinjiangensis]|uniref:glycohydrolase toxin TNT-related protein n=1 Tax=Saccharomonospora xinjiangensis TaxID=75294 RepID=UPI00350FA2F1
MGVELPAELAGIADATGVSWPEADEDALREQAEAWRKAARELTSLSGDADTCAERALAAMSGPAAETARQRWATLADADSGSLAEAARNATLAADRLDNAAEQVGRAKVEIVRRLVDAATTRNAALVAADAGHPSALLAVDTVLRGAAGDLGMVTRDLVEAVSSSAAPVEGVTRHAEQAVQPGGVAGAVAGAVGDAGAAGAVREMTGGGPGEDAGLVGAVREVVGGPVKDTRLVGVPAEPDITEQAEDTGLAGLPESIIAERLDPADEPLLPDSGEETHGGVPPLDDAAATEDTGPIAIAQLPTPPSGQFVPGIGADAPTPPSGTVLRPPDAGGQPPFAGPQAGHAGQVGQTHLSGLAPSALPSAVPPPVAYQPPPVAPTVVPNVPQYGAPPQWGGYGGQVQPPMYAPGGQQAQFGAVPQGVPPQAPGAQAPPQGRAVQWNAPNPAAPHAQQGPAPQAPAAQQPQPGQQSPHQAPAPPPAPPRPGAAAVAVGAPRQERESVVALFVVHMFPIGHLPVASDTPARQLPAPEEEADFGVARFPPHDHPDSGLIDVEHALSALRGGGRRPAPPPAEVLPGVPAEVIEGHDPLGEVSELEWDRRYLVRDGERPEFAWPPPERFPEGCHEPGEPVLLDEGEVLDRFGSAHGRVFAADGTRFAQRSLPPWHLGSGYRRYRVVRQMPVWKAVSAPWFGQPGGGVRYRTVYSAAELVVLGHLADITFEERA